MMDGMDQMDNINKQNKIHTSIPLRLCVSALKKFSHQLNFYSLLFIFTLVFSSCFSGEPSLEVYVESSSEGLERPLSGTVTITHSPNDKIDPQSFTLDGKPLQVDLVKRVGVGVTQDKEGTNLTIYHFEIPPQKEGRHVLNPVSVKINNKLFSSDSFEYTVHAPKSSQNEDNNLLFLLESEIEGPSPLYPGQRAKLVYRIYFNRSIDITESVLPMLSADHFRKIGDKEVQQVEDEGITLQQISQEIEAIKPGSYPIDASFVEGRAYQENEIGQKVYQGSKIRAESPALEIIVLNFPKENQPLSFGGAIGDLEMSLALVTPSEIELGDRIQLKLSIKSSYSLDTFKLPNLNCEPGFSGFFSIDGLSPALGTPDSKSYLINLRAKTSLVQGIPPIEIASFDPKTEKYQIWQSKPISLKVKQPKLMTPVQLEVQKLDDQAIANLEKRFSLVPAGPLPIDQAVNPKWTKQDQSWLETLKVLYIVPVGALLILLQWIMKGKFSGPSLLIAMLMTFSAEAAEDPRETLLKANSDYQKGIEATTLQERQKFFNEALLGYKSVESFSLERLQEAIGDAYFQLGEYAWAAAYYYLAINRDSQNLNLKLRLNEALEKLGLPAYVENYDFAQFLSFNDYLSLSFKYSLFFWIALFFFILYSLNFWFPCFFLKVARNFLFLLTGLFFLNLALSNFLLSRYGVIVEQSELFSAPDSTIGLNLSTQLKPGMKVVVLDVQKEGKWIKIETNGAIGYTPYKTIVIL